MNLMRFTPKATELFHFIESDIGRPLKHITSQIEYTEFITRTKEVLITLIPEERDVKKKNGTWYSMRIYPYRTTDNKIAGVVISFIDINKKLQFARAIVDTIKRPVLFLNKDLRIVLANQVFYNFFQTTPETIENMLFFEMGDGQWKAGELKDLFNTLLSKKKPIKDYKFKNKFSTTGEKELLLNAKILETSKGSKEGILLTLEDTTQLQGRQ
jgi:two-component system CheB/CheR fusion protein